MSFAKDLFESVQMKMVQSIDEYERLEVSTVIIVLLRCVCLCVCVCVCVHSTCTVMCVHY